jgi:hypothetical protein
MAISSLVELTNQNEAETIKIDDAFDFADKVIAVTINASYFHGSGDFGQLAKSLLNALDDNSMASRQECIELLKDALDDAANDDRY